MRRILITGWVMACWAGGLTARGQAPAPSPFVEHGDSAMPATPEQLARPDFEQGAQLLHDKKYVRAAEAFQRAVTIAPKYYEAYKNWGIALAQAGRESATDEQRLQQYQTAAEKFGKAAELRADDKVLYVMWSETLVLLGDLPLDSRTRLSCYLGAVEKLRLASKIDAEDWEIYNKWGVVLITKLADYAKNEPAKMQLYRDAAKLFEKAAQWARFSKDIGTMDANWAEALVQLARLTSNPIKKQDALRVALNKFEESAAAFPPEAGTCAMWGAALLELGRSTRMRNDLRTAADKLNSSLRLRPDDPGVLYHLACVYTLLENPVLALDNLKKCFDLDRTNTYRTLANTDPDLELLRRESSFKDLVASGTRRPPPKSR